MLKVLLVVIVLGLAIYATIRLLQHRGVALKAKPATRRARPPARPPARPQGPDDDEDFLRDLDRRRRHPEDPGT